jgi:hypothetical protein
MAEVGSGNMAEPLTGSTIALARFVDEAASGLALVRPCDRAAHPK